MSNIDEKVNELLERAKEYGLSLNFDSGLIIVKQAATDDPARQRDIIEELGKYLVHIRRLVERRAHGARGKDYLGQKIWLPDYEEGELTEANCDGSLSVSVKIPGSRSLQTLTTRAENLLIVVKDAPAPVNEESVSEMPRKRLFGLI
jgi:hypothetical protein